jgi:hypothetical protein
MRVNASNRNFPLEWEHISYGIKESSENAESIFRSFVTVNRTLDWPIGRNDSQCLYWTDIAGTCQFKCHQTQFLPISVSTKIILADLVHYVGLEFRCIDFEASKYSFSLTLTLTKIFYYSSAGQTVVWSFLNMGFHRFLAKQRPFSSPWNQGQTLIFALFLTTSLLYMRRNYLRSETFPESPQMSKSDHKQSSYGGKCNISGRGSRSRPNSWTPRLRI